MLTRSPRGETFMSQPTDLVQGTLEVLILKVVALEASLKEV
jgi:hypothetical protein